MESWLISFELSLHVAAGQIGAILAFPLTIAARKGSSWHKISGRVFAGAFVIICLTDCLLDFDEILDLIVSRPWSKLIMCLFCTMSKAPLALGKLS